jgi:hypothetical protein
MIPPFAAALIEYDRTCVEALMLMQVAGVSLNALKKPGA